MAYDKKTQKKLKEEYAEEAKSNKTVYLGLELSEEKKEDLVKRVLFDVEKDEQSRVELN